MHSTFSDGSGSVEEIATAASATGLDYFILTDHNTMKARKEGLEKWYGNSMLIVGCEINDLDNKNHYLVLGLDKIVGKYEKLQNGEYGNSKSAIHYVNDVKNAGGIGFIAHPHEKRDQFPEHPPYPWIAWECEEFNGIEIWNHMSEWIEGLNSTNKLQRFLHPLKSIVAPPIETIKKWDEVNLKRKVTGIGGVDAHAHKINVMGLYETEIFPYKVLFKSIRTNVLLKSKLNPGVNETIEYDKRQIIEALAEGRCYIANYYHGETKGFRFYARYGGNIYTMGDVIELRKSVETKVLFEVLLPKVTLIKLIKNGIDVHSIQSEKAVWETDEPGNYRVEVWLGDRAWIFTNHIRVI